MAAVGSNTGYRWLTCWFAYALVGRLAGARLRDGTDALSDSASSNLCQIYSPAHAGHLAPHAKLNATASITRYAATRTNQQGQGNCRTYSVGSDFGRPGARHPVPSN